MEGPLTWPGQHAGFLGPEHDPWQITRDPERRRLPRGQPAPGAGHRTIDRLDDRRSAARPGRSPAAGSSPSWPSAAGLSDQQQLAFSVLTSGKIARAFEMDREPAAVRDRYGRHAFGQSLLLARRLVQAGVPVVQANMGRVQNWDTHGDNFPPPEEPACCRRWTRASPPCSTIWRRRACSTTRW